MNRVDPTAAEAKTTEASKDVRQSLASDNAELYTATLKTLLPALVAIHASTSGATLRLDVLRSLLRLIEPCRDVQILDDALKPLDFSP